jgi:3-oxosteroid 1-dehydrogenase
VKEETFDFVIVGSGAGSVPAALVMKKQGHSVVILEKLPRFGGTTATSGGVVWLPDNPVVNTDNPVDSPERARTYMIASAGASASDVPSERRDAYIRGSREMVDFLQAEGMIFVDAHWPDYRDDLPGGLPSGRSLATTLFDVNELGDWKDRLHGIPLTTDTPMLSQESVDLFLVMKTWKGKKAAARIAWRLLQNKLFGKAWRGAGPALSGRLFKLAKDARVPIWTDCPVTDFIVENGKVAGVSANKDGQKLRINARLGVLVNAGGFSRNLDMRECYQPKPTSTDWTIVNPGDTGEMIEAMQRLGGVTKFMDESWWLASSFHPDGSLAGFHSPNDISKPHIIVVGKDGKRFHNESCGYMEFGQAIYRAGAVPAWAIFDIRHRKSYPFGTMMPGRIPKALVANGYLKTAETIEELAAQCGIDAAGLAATVKRFNGFAISGKDEDFRRGESVYNNYYGDPTHGPNPNLGTIEKSPFFAVAIWPADVGTAGGIVADEFGRAVRDDGSVIAGLYVTGNSSAAVNGRCYPGAGSSIGPSMVFGYIAARHAARTNS